MVAALIAAAAPDAALAHAGERGFVLLMPTGYYIVGGAAAVAFSFLALAALPASALRRAYAEKLVWRRKSLGLETLGSSLSFLVFVGLLAAGLEGSRDPLTNPLPLVIWTLWWVGLTLATALLGDLWRGLNPWTGPARLLRRLALLPEAPLALPGWVGVWPASLGLLGFAWFEIVSLAPSDPTRLAQAAGVYWIVQFIGFLLFGEAEWRRRGESFSVFFGFIAMLAPVWTRPAGDRVETVAGLPGAKLLDAPAPSTSGALFILLALSIVTFDGVNETFWWLAQIDVNPLEFPGRSAVMVENTLGLLTSWALVAGLFTLAVWLGRRLAGVAAATGDFGRLALTLVPIALGYHFAHYLLVLMVQGQYALAVATDPFGRGDDWLGLGAHHVTTSFLYDAERVSVIWRSQAFVVAAAHLLSVLLSHLVAHDAHSAGGARRVVLSQLPLAALMVGYTLLGLWLLATPAA